MFQEVFDVPDFVTYSSDGDGSSIAFTIAPLTEGDIGEHTVSI
jgi:hypothetical protein